MFRNRRSRNADTVYARCRLPEEGETAHQRLRRVLEDGRHLGAPAHVPGVWARGLLRFVEQSPRARTLSSDAAPADSISGARRELALVLHRRDVSVASRLARFRFSLFPGRALRS